MANRPTAIKLKCPKCSQVMQANRGTKVRCPKCQAVIRVPPAEKKAVIVKPAKARALAKPRPTHRPPPVPTRPAESVTYPQTAMSTTHVIVHQDPTNGMGIAGFVLSLVAILSVGLLAPVALIVSFIGLFKEPRGFAIAGTVISMLGLAPLIVFGGIVLAFIGGMGAAIDAAEERREERMATQAKELLDANQSVENAGP